MTERVVLVTSPYGIIGVLPLWQTIRFVFLLYIFIGCYSAHVFYRQLHRNGAVRIQKIFFFLLFWAALYFRLVLHYGRYYM